MKSQKFKILSLVLIALALVTNIYLAANYYKISSIRLSNNFYWQSVNDVWLIIK
jgi:hypothetical protein